MKRILTLTIILVLLIGAGLYAKRKFYDPKQRLENANKQVIQLVEKNEVFEWTDDKIYCSELIWKVYKEATGLEVGKLEKLKDFDLTSKPVLQKMNERYGSNIPLDEIVISPASIYNSGLLMTVKSN